MLARGVGRPPEGIRFCSSVACPQELAVQKRQEKALWDVKPGTHDENSPQAARKAVSRSRERGRRGQLGRVWQEPQESRPVRTERGGQLLRCVSEKSGVNVAPMELCPHPNPTTCNRDLLGEKVFQDVMKLRVFRWNNPGLTLNPMACARTNVRQREIRDTREEKTV